MKVVPREGCFSDSENDRRTYSDEYECGRRKSCDTVRRLSNNRVFVCARARAFEANRTAQRYGLIFVREDLHEDLQEPTRTRATAQHTANIYLNIIDTPTDIHHRAQRCFILARLKGTDGRDGLIVYASERQKDSFF